MIELYVYRYNYTQYKRLRSVKNIN